MSASASAGAPRRLKLIKNANHVRNGTMAYGRALRKYNMKPTLCGPFDAVDQTGPADTSQPKPARGAARKLVKKDVEGKVLGQVTAQDLNTDTEYTGQIWSCDLPKNSRGAGNHNIFDHTKSSTFKWCQGQTFNISYNDGSNAAGSVSKDVVDIGGLVVKNQTVELAETISQTYLAQAADGVLGLGWSAQNSVQPTRFKTPVENMVAQSTIPPSGELFTAHLGSYKDPTDPDRSQSFYTFGYIDKDVLKSHGSDIYYTPVDNSTGFWQFPTSSYTINGTTTKTVGRTAIADTGTSLILLDDASCKAVYDAIPGSKYSKEAGGYVFPKTTTEDKLPSIGFDIGGKTFKMNKEDLGYAPVSSDALYGGIQSAGDLPFNVYGESFLKSVYAVFDVGKQRFGCTQHVDPDKPKAPEKKDVPLAAQKDVPKPPAPANTPGPTPAPPVKPAVAPSSAGPTNLAPPPASAPAQPQPPAQKPSQTPATPAAPKTSAQPSSAPPQPTQAPALAPAQAPAQAPVPPPTPSPAPTPALTSAPPSPATVAPPVVAPPVVAPQPSTDPAAPPTQPPAADPNVPPPPARADPPPPAPADATS